MIKKVEDYVKKYQMIEAHDIIVAGVSGGADSVCLLFVLLEIQKQIPFTMKVVHVNHGIREDAVNDAEFVRGLCESHDIPFFLVEEDIVSLAKQSGCSTEEEGRRVRYQAFYQVLGSDKGKIAVAHNSNDRAETMLFHLFRGTGLSGMAGIRPLNGKVIRPLLCVTREEIEGWLLEKGISYCTDSTNGQDGYTRNRIRHHILPYAEQEICRGAVGHMNRAADDCMMAEEYLRRETEKAMKRCVWQDKEGIKIRISVFEKEDAYLKGRVLLSCIEKAVGVKKDITWAHIHSIEKLFETSGSKEIHLPYGLVVFKKYDLGMIQKYERGATCLETLNAQAPCSSAACVHPDACAPLSQNVCVENDMGHKYGPIHGQEESYLVSVPGEITIPNLGIVEFTVFPADKYQNIPEKKYTKWFDYDKISSSMAFRTRQKGDYLTVKGSSGKMGHKLLQDYFVNEKIPKEERDQIYILTEGSHVLWIPGRRISEYYKIDEGTQTVLQVTVPDQAE